MLYVLFRQTCVSNMRRALTHFDICIFSKIQRAVYKVAFEPRFEMFLPSVFGFFCLKMI
ncbi:hypothetical protein KFK09_010215 [Dendrobium nobile]|uniref:Uncharacterized protein n=1 Tax=Dendrobium nobile TaxID=94219 RepID=A0A8T3BJY9_DENNO|nr:hypothetical protein KFK09_010215 [Dendrobium nobile]